MVTSWIGSFKPGRGERVAERRERREGRGRGEKEQGRGERGKGEGGEGTGERREGKGESGRGVSGEWRGDHFPKIPVPYVSLRLCLTLVRYTYSTKEIST